MQPGDPDSRKPKRKRRVSGAQAKQEMRVAYSELSLAWQLAIGIGCGLSVLNSIFLLATSLAPILNADNIAATLSVQVALLSLVLVFGGFGIAVVGFSGWKSIREDALNQAAEQAQVAITKLWADRTSPQQVMTSSELDESVDDGPELEASEP